MKKVTKFFMAALLAGMCSFGYAQDYLNAPKANEKVIGTISVETAANPNYYPANDNVSEHRYNFSTMQRWYETLLVKARQEFPGKNVEIRNMEVGRLENANGWGVGTYYGPATGKVVVTFWELINSSLSQVLNKALRNVREGSRLAIDQVSVPFSIDKDDLKDQLLDVLLDKGYRVVAKDYLEKLYEEQEAQQSGIYNDKTTVQENNFSAVGYYINVKVTETSLRVQVVNVSTGEYEGNATVNF